MKLFYNWTGGSKPSVVTVGNFDGVHRGHAALLATMCSQRYAGMCRLVLTFEPHPLAFLTPARAPKRLVDLRTKASLLADAGIDQLNVLHFTDSFASMQAVDFVTTLRKQLGMQALVTGLDFRFGTGRSGNIEMLQEMAPQADFALQIIADSNSSAGERVSSKLLRAVIADADFVRAAQLLGHPYTFGGRVTYGQQFGQKLGCPTANLSLRIETPLHGVYAAWAQVDGTRWPAALAVGMRPAIGGTNLSTEVSLLDFTGGLYGSYLSVQPVQKLREERDFPDLDSLRHAMQEDIANCRQLLVQA